jgi:putative alpha-1,2-mannosidase
VFTSLGIYPVAGTSVYLLSTPLFPEYSVRRATAAHISQD